MILLLYSFFAYFLGSIPFGFLLARYVKGIDIRQHGSRNIGATNVMRVVGKKWGLFVFFLDSCKGYLAVQLPVMVEHASQPLQISLALGVIAILGHTFPVWLAFRGGKGVATSLGIFLSIAPLPTLVAFSLWVVVFGITRIISAASLSVALIFPILIIWLERNRDGFFLLWIISSILTLFIFFTHRSNIRRLLKGEEKPLF